MNITLTITGGTAAEIKEAVFELSSSFAVNAKGELQHSVDVPAEPKKPAKAEKPEKTEAPVKVENSANAEVTMEEVRAAIGEKAKNGKRDEMKKILAEYGADNLTALDKSHYAEVLDKVKAA